VAIKVAKKLGKLSGWQKECADMQRLRKRACALGSDMLSLHEQYVPTCIEVGQDGKQAFYVMHAAGIDQVKSYTGMRALKTKEEKKKMFVALWVSVYALHGVGYTHNDLHGGNIVVDQDQNVALIDFGELKGHHAGKGYKHDINSVWQWTSVVLSCKKSEWGMQPKPQLRVTKKNYLNCIKEEIGGDDEFLKVMDSALEAAMVNDKNQHLTEIFQTKFIQSNLAPYKRLFRWSDMDGCLKWDWKKIIGQETCTDLPGYFKCPQESRPGACYGGGNWDCWREGDDYWGGECKDKGFKGACVYPDHGKSIKKANEVKSCAAINECDNCKAGSWGACYVKDKTGVPDHLKCFCVAPSNTFVITKSLIKYGCSTKRIQGKNKAYDGLCKLDGFFIPKAGQKPKAATAQAAPAASLNYKKGDKIKCKTRSGAWKGCQVLAAGKAKARVQFDGYSAKTAKWLPAADLKA